MGGGAAGLAAALQPAARLRAELRAGVAVAGAAGAAAVRDGLGAAAAPQAQARARGPAAPLLRSAQRLSQAEGGGIVLIRIAAAAAVARSVPECQIFPARTDKFLG